MERVQEERSTDLELCRACCEVEEQVVYLFEDSPDALAHMFRTCTGIQIDQHDGLPHYICAACETDLHNAYRFYRRCQDINNTLRSSVLSIERIADEYDSCWLATESTSAMDHEMQTESTFTEDKIDKDELSNQSVLAPDVVDPIEPKSMVGTCNDAETESNRSHENDRGSIKVPVRDSNRSFQCTECGKCFANKRRLTSHEATHLAKRFRCNLCKKHYSSHPSLMRHIKTIHENIKQYECPVCGKQFAQKVTLQFHKRVHEVKYYCEYCPVKFGKEETLTRHRKVHFPPDTSDAEILQAIDERKCKHMVCTFCGKVSKSYAVHIVHLRIHTGKRPYECTECSKHFISSSSLKRHSKVHQDLRPFKCTVCESSFRQRAHLKTHSLLHKIT